MASHSGAAGFCTHGRPQAGPPSGPWECVQGAAATEEWAGPCNCGHTPPPEKRKKNTPKPAFPTIWTLAG